MDSSGHYVHHFQFPQPSFFPEGIWKHPYLYVSAPAFDTDDSFWVFDQDLNLVHQGYPISNQYLRDYAVAGDNVLKVGQDFNFEGGHLESENLITHEGPKYYDIEFVNFTFPEPGVYDSSAGCPADDRYYFPIVKISVRNNSDFPVSEFEVEYHDRNCCPDDVTWRRKISGFTLSPGETKEFSLNDILLPRHGLGSDPFYTCLHIIRPDTHADDEFTNNTLCLEARITSTHDFGDGPRIHIYPNPVSGTLYIHAMQEDTGEIMIYTPEGRLVATYTLAGLPVFDIDTGSWPPGIYMLRCHLSDGEMITGKMIKL